MKWLLTYLLPYKWTFIFLILLSTITNGIELTIPKIIQYFIDEILPKGKLDQLVLLVFILVSLIILMLFSRSLASLKQRQFSEKAASNVQLTILEHLRNLGIAYFERRPVGHSLALMNTEVSIVQELFKDLLPNVLNSLVFCSIAIAMMITIDIKILILVTVLIIIYFFIGPKYEEKAALAARDFSDSRVSLHQKIYESVSAVKEVKINNAINWELGRINTKQVLYHKWLLKNVWYGYLRGSIRRVIVAVGGLCIFCYGYWAINNGQKTIGDITALILYFNFSMLEITYLITGITELRLVIYQTEQLYDFVKSEPEVKEINSPIILPAVTGQLEFKKVHFGYDAQHPILRGIDFKINAGERVAFIGRSGNGKSTILKLLGRFYDPQSGDILIDGKRIKDLHLKQLRNAIGYVFQETYLFGFSVMENIRFGKPEASDEEIYRVAKLVNMHDFIIHLPDGYDTHVGEKGVLLSGGQRQRIAIARMFLKDPVIIIMDEPTSSLDNISESEIQQALEKLIQGRTVITVAHRLSTIKDFDVVYCVEDGKIARKGSPSEMIPVTSII
ncbi:ABC transporter ATP-binding protein [Paenibacillus sp. KS-LC4]|uniref:ABC transporter ATP-binding protein n=1 Tax=Paenibacillus sp. KS-LC4 TaxID=2979727 RepID=UPI0030D46B68